MTVICYYTCNLLPRAFLARSGCDPRRLRPTDASASRGDVAMHPTICPYVVDLVAAGDSALRADPAASLVVPAGCDAMRRAGDHLGSRFADQVFTFLLPRSPGDDAADALSHDLERLEHWLRDRVQASPPAGGTPGPLGDPGVRAAGGDLAEDPEVDREAAGPDSGALFELTDTFQAGGILVVGGPLSNAGLLESIVAHGVPISAVESCTSPERTRALDAAVSVDTPPIEVARAVLSEVTCPRSDSGQRRAHLNRRIDEAQPAAVLYARLPFCDPGAYDSLLVSALAAERGLPYLEIEVGFPFELSGPLRVRLEAFVETLTLGGATGDDDLFGDELFDDALAAAPVDGD